ncbi:MAG: hypothetical protein KDA65_18710 [Planctomycetaceae bacterium]|nr:hypothetical protein [Planctomycetaceae bacterium]
MNSSSEESGLIPIQLPHPERFPGTYTVANWLVDVGEDFLVGERLVEVISPGVLFIVDAPVEGCLARIDVPVDGSLTATTTLGWIQPTINE